MQVYSERYAPSGQPGVRVEQLKGQVRIKGHEEKGVLLAASCQSDQPVADRLEINQSDDWLEIIVREQHSIFHLFGPEPPAVDLDLKVPVGTTCVVLSGSGNVELHGTQALAEIETGSGNVIVTEVADLTAETGSGTVDVGRVQGEISVETGSGDVTAVEVDGELKLETGSGQIKVSRALGSQLRAETGSGNLLLRGLDVANLEIETGSGHVSVELLNVHPLGTYRVETSSGNVTVVVPVDAAAEFNLRADSGRLRCDGFKLQVLEKQQDALSALLGGGGGELHVEVGSGTVTVQPGPATGRGDRRRLEV